MKKNTRVYSLRRRLGLLLYRWHRRIGFIASVFLIWMAVSGWLLNHTGSLDLGRRYLINEFITAHYGIRNEIPTRAFITDDHWLAIEADAAVLDGKKIAVNFLHPQGMVEIHDTLFIADTTNLILLDKNGELIDKVSISGAIDRIGVGCGGAVIVNAGKQQLATQDGINFTACDDNVQWSREATLTESQRTIATPLLSSGVTAERVLLDLHSGRFFGAFGPYFVDALGFAMIALALSGIWLFLRQHKRRQ
jgi:hypothetical protein